MQAVTTTYRGATNTKGSKIIASTASGIRLHVPYDHALGAEGNHRAAAHKLRDNLLWTNELIGGGLSDSSEVWVMIPRGYKLVQVGE